MAHLSDDALYNEAVRRMQPDDSSLLYWYARLDTTTRHRLNAVANARHPDATILAPNTLNCVLMMLLTDGSYMRELLTIKEASLQTKLENTASRFGIKPILH